MSNANVCKCMRENMYALARGDTRMYLQYVPGVDMSADNLFWVSTRFFGDKGMALGSATDQMADVLA